MINVNDFRDAVMMVWNTKQRGGVQENRFNLAMQLANRQLFSERYGVPMDTGPNGIPMAVKYNGTQKVHDDLRFWIVTETLTLDSNGRADIPSDLIHPAAFLWRYFVNPENCEEALPTSPSFRKIKWVTEDKIGSRTGSSVVAPSLNLPVVVQMADYYQFYPVNLAYVEVIYLQQPDTQKPVWGYTTNSANRPVYDPNTSTDLKWGPGVFNTLVGYTLQYLGQNLRDADLVQIAATDQR